MYQTLILYVSVPCENGFKDSCTPRSRGRYSLKHVGGMFIFKSNLNEHDELIENIESSLWKKIVKLWCEINYDHKPFVTGSDTLWLNSNLGKVFYDKGCVDNGLIYIKQLYNGDDIIKYEDICDRFNIHLDFISYHSIVQAVRTKYSEENNNNNEKQIETKNECKNTVHTLLNKPQNKVIGKQLYSCLIKKKVHYDCIQSKWSNIIEIAEDTERLFNQIEQMTNVNKLRSFQFKLLHRIVFFNDKLFKFRKVNTTLCDFCNESLDSLEHRLIYCRETQAFWQDVQKLIKAEYNINCNMNNANLIITNICQAEPLVETILLNAKYYMYTCFLNKTIPKVSNFKNILLNIEDTERYSAINRNKMDNHNIKWKRA